MTQKVIFSGFGGQGIMSAGLILAEAAVLSDFNVTYFPSYGAEMRGGTANCHVTISNQEIASPIITQADSLIAMNKPSLVKFSNIVKENGLIIYDSSVIKEKVDIKSKEVIEVSADEIALEKLGNPKVANIIILGVYIKKFICISLEKLKKAIFEKFKEKGEKLININYKALELGYSLLDKIKIFK